MFGSSSQADAPFHERGILRSETPALKQTRTPAPAVGIVRPARTGKTNLFRPLGLDTSPTRPPAKSEPPGLTLPGPSTPVHGHSIAGP